MLRVIIAGKERPDDRYPHTYICRAGMIANCINLNVVFKLYTRLGIDAPKDEVRGLCNIEIKQYGTSNAPFVYFNAATDADLLAMGLLLCYSLESTASALVDTI
jgi:hypothetical protein